MGDNAEMILDGVIDSLTGEYIGKAVGYPRTIEPRDKEKYSESTKNIRKELAILIKVKKKMCSTDKEKSIAVNNARQEINMKYGKGWREQL